MESRSIEIKSAQNSKLSIDIIPGHFATSHSHVNYYVDMTKIKHCIAMAQEKAAATLASDLPGDAGGYRRLSGRLPKRWARCWLAS